MCSKKSTVLNKAILKAVAEGHPLYWSFGQYRKWYEGLILRAHTGFAENGHCYTRFLYATQNMDMAADVRAQLMMAGAGDNGWNEACLAGADRAVRRRPNRKTG